ncbi:uncharacterized protein LOC106670378 isoform X2 [Cimex lectularius]|uniref:THD domain-containing protein n=1 Tax=Cimex lectularius TaxID=79782 RepID=A0A8I6S0X0_CIMLE|nr:uncharacterized protein LOC106670378 isoform X2 [Cimex lectularius]
MEGTKVFKSFDANCQAPNERNWYNAKVGPVQTKIKINSEEIPSKIGVTVFSVPDQPTIFKPKGILAAGIVILFVLFLVCSELRETKLQLQEVQALVARMEEKASSLDRQRTYDETKEGTILEADASNIRFKREASNENKTRAYPLVANFIGAYPESVIKEGGVISPWFKDPFNSGEFSLGDVALKDGKGSAVVPETGLYFVYAQVYYSNAAKPNSFSIKLLDFANQERVIATCVNPPASVGESTCYTATVQYIRKGTKVQLWQRETDRYVLFRRGQTFFGIVLLRPTETEP